MTNSNGTTTFRARRARVGFAPSGAFSIALIAAAHLFLASTVDADALKDPTRPPGPTAADPLRAPAAALRLEAILQSANRRIAIVNGKIVHAGDRLDSAFIEEITSDSVRYTRAGREHTIHLREASSVHRAWTDRSGND